MPSRNLYHREWAGSLLITPRAQIDSETNILDKACNADLDIEEWNDWMRWDSAAVELDPPMLGRKDRFESSISGYETGPADLEKVGVSSSTENEVSFEDAPFEFEEPPQSCHGLQLDMPFQTTPQMPLDLRRPVRGYSTLTAAEQQSLQGIATPYRMLPQVKIPSEPSSPTTSNSMESRSTSQESETQTRGKGKKRKWSIDEEEVPNAQKCQSRKRGHNAIEKRYRTNLNDKINRLRQGIPPFWRRSSSDSKAGDEREDSDPQTVDKRTGQQKYGKAAILTRALEYIQHLESTNQSLSDEVAVLRTQAGGFEKYNMGSSGIVLNDIAAPSELTNDTLQSVQAGMPFSGPLLAWLRLTLADFKQVERQSKSVSGPATNRRDSKTRKQTR